jgi:hypothetical protein
MKKITTEQYQKALRTVALYECQVKPQKVHVSVTYKVEITVHITLPEPYPLMK